MGAWGAGNFENDDASDWVWELDAATDHAHLEQALTNVLNSEEMESPECCCALAAAEVVAAVNGQPGSVLPESVEGYIERVKIKPSAELISTAVNALEKIKADSELKELWEEADSFDEWVGHVDELLYRLKTS